MKKVYLSVLCCFVTFLIQAQWTADRKINTPVAAVNASDIQTISAGGGKTWIAFYSQHGANYDMRAQLLAADGKRLLGDSGVLVSNKPSGSATYVFNVCVDKDSSLIIAFQIEKNSSYECYTQKVNTSGNLLWGAGVDLGPGLSPYPVTLSTNEIAFAWSNNGKINYQKLSIMGGEVWGAYKAFPSTASVSRPQLTATTNGGFSMVYQSTVAFPFYTNLYEQRFTNNGEAVWATASKLSSITTVSYRYFDVHADGDTTYIAYYGNPSGSNRFNAYVQKVSDKGKVLWGTNGSAFADYAGNFDPYEQTIYMAKGKNTNDVWAVCTITNYLQTTSGVYVQKFDANTGARYFGPNAKMVVPITSRLGSLAFSNVSLCDDDYPVFLITDADNLLAAVKLRKDGNPMWKNIYELLATGKHTKFRYGFSDFYNGQAVAVWQENKGFGDMPFAQNIRCSGTTGPNSNQVMFNKADVNSLSIKTIYPNPVQNMLTVIINSTEQSNTRFYITDVSGNVLKQFEQKLQQGDNTIQVNVATIKTGSCFIKLVNEKGSASTIFNKQ